MKNVPARRVFDELHRKAGIRFEVSDALQSRIVSIELEALSPPDALRQVLRGLDITAYAVLHDPASSPAAQRVLIYDEPSASTSSVFPTGEDDFPRDPAAAAIESDLAANDPGFIPSQTLLARLVR